MDDIPRYYEECAYCYNSDRDGPINYCCSVPICNEHLKIHKNHTPIYSVHKINNEILIESYILPEFQKDEIKQFIKNKSNISDIDIFRVYCSHKNMPEHPKSDIKEQNICGFTSCGLRKNLFICLSCGFIGCARKQFGSEGNGHAKSHYELTSHPINVRIDSLQLDGSNLSYCYVCDEYIINNEIQADLQLLGFNMKELAHINQKHFEIDEKKEDTICNDPVDSSAIEYVGIENEGNTCYISTILQILSLSFDENFDVYFCEHFPIECFLCQFTKAMNGLKNKKKKSIKIKHFIDTVMKDHPNFSRGSQQDPNEFLLQIFEKFRMLHEIEGLPSIRNKYLFETEKKTECDKCGDACSIDINYDNFHINYMESVQKSIDAFFEDEFFPCTCGGNKKRTTKINKFPTFMILTVNRWKQENGSVVKIKESEDFISNDIVCLQNSKKYIKCATIIHKGNSVYSGHYVVKISNAIINDTNVTLESFDGEEYMYLYEIQK